MSIAVNARAAESISMGVRYQLSFLISLRLMAQISRTDVKDAKIRSRCESVVLRQYSDDRANHHQTNASRAERNVRPSAPSIDNGAGRTRTTRANRINAHTPRNPAS